MSTTTNKGSQVITVDYKLPLKARDFSQQLYSLVKPGVYQGLDISITENDNNKINITAGQAYLHCSFQNETKRAIKVQFASNVNALQIVQSVTGVDELVYLYYEYKEIIENWVAISHCSAEETPPVNSVVIGRCIYSASGFITDISYEDRDFGFFNDDFTISDSNEFSNALDNNKRFKFSASGVSGINEVRVIDIPDHNYKLNTIADWASGVSYLNEEVVVFNNAIYRTNENHISSSSFYDDILKWENITANEDREIIRGFNNSGSSLSSGKCVKISGDNSSELIPEIDLINDYLNEPFGIVVSNINDNESGELIQRGRIELPDYDFSSGVIGQKVYSDNTGTLTLTITPLMIGQLLDPANSIIYVSILPAEEGLNTSNFNGQLSVLENTIQKAFDRIDDYGYLPIWETGKAYRVGNSITKDGVIYTCLVAHTSGTFLTDLNANYWLKVQTYLDPTNFNGQLSSGVETSIQLALDRLDDYGYLPPWVTGKSYRVGNSFTYNNVPYIVLTAHTSGTFSDDLISGYFTQIILDSLKFSNIKTDSSSGIVNALNVTGTSIVRLTSATVLNGILAPTTVKSLIVINLTGLTITIGNNSGSANAADRIITSTGSDLSLLNTGSINLVYDSTSGNWRITGVGSSTSILDSYISRGSASVASGGGTTNIASIFGSQVAATYRFKCTENNQIWGYIYFQGITTYDLQVNSFTVFDTQGNSGTLNIYLDGSDITFENRTSSDLTLVVYREV